MQLSIMTPGHLPLERFRSGPTGRKHEDRWKTRRNCLSHLSWEPLRIPSGEGGLEHPAQPAAAESQLWTGKWVEWMDGLTRR